MARREKLFAGGRLRAVRERLGQTQGVFAGRLGLSVSYLSQIETDRRPITMDLLLALNAFNLMKIVVFREDAGYVFLCLTVLVLSLQLAPSTRAWSRR